MRNLLFFWFLLGAFENIASQNLDIARHALRENPKHLVSINSKCYYLEEGYMRMVGVDANAQVTFSAALPGLYVNTVHRMIKTNDNCLAAIGTGLGCDLPYTPNRLNFITKKDTNGVLIFQTNIQVFYGLAFDKIVDFTQHTDSSYYIISDSLLYHYSKSGMLVSRINTGLNTLKSIITLNNGNLLLSGKLANTQKILEITTTASIVTQQNINSVFAKLIQTPGGSIYGLSSANRLVKLNSNLTVSSISSVGIAPNFSIRDFMYKNDSLFMTGVEITSNTPFYMISDQNFNILYQTPTSTYKNIIPNGITIDNRNRINIITRDLSTLPGRVSSMSQYQFPITGNFISGFDIGVASFSVLNAYIDNGWGVCNLNATVKNFTGDTIKSFYLNYHGFFTFTCQQVSLHKFYSTVILPYGSAMVQTGNFYFEIPGFNAPYDICVFTTAPNTSTDKQVDNDAFCKTIALTIGINEEMVAEAVLNIFPNPFNHQLSIESVAEIKRITLYNASGKIVRDFCLKNTSCKIESSELPSGIYLLKIDTEKGIQVKKLIKN